MQSKLRDGFLPVTRLGYQFHICLSLDEGRDALTQERMIIHRHDPNRRFYRSVTGAHEILVLRNSLNLPLSSDFS